MQSIHYWAYGLTCDSCASMASFIVDDITLGEEQYETVIDEEDDELDDKQE